MLKSSQSVFVRCSAPVVVILCDDVDVAAIAQALKVAADRALGYVQRITDISLWDNSLAVFVSDFIQDKI